MQRFGRREDAGQPSRLDIAGGTIARTTPCAPSPAQAERWPWIAPGMIDIQFNGYWGQEFSSAQLTPEMVEDISRQMDCFGVVRFCPTLTTESFDVLVHALRTIAAACDSSPAVARRVAGIHVEGPYISPQEGARGAHPREHCRPPDWDEFQRMQEAADGRIEILTLSAEFDESPAFVEQVATSGVVVGIGHTAADSEQIRATVDAGARLSTHLGNGCHAVLPRHHNYVWDQLAEDRLTAGLIVDGHHLPPAVVKTFVRAKGPKRCLLVSDMAGQAGLPPGRYGGGLCEVEVLPGGRLVVAGQTELMAGAAKPIGAGVANVIRFAGVSLAEAVGMAVHQPARVLSIEAGNLNQGDPADLVQFDLTEPCNDTDQGGFQLRTTVQAGEVVFGTAELAV